MLEKVQMSMVMELQLIYSVMHITPYVKVCTYVTIHMHACGLLSMHMDAQSVPVAFVLLFQTLPFCRC